MTNEEAKKIIFNQWQAFLEDNIDYGGISEAYKMAIKALEQQPSEDCISRQKALDCFEQTNTRQGAKHAIETLPSVTPQQTRWIPVSERLPEREGWYLISLGEKTYGGADVDMYCKGWVKYGTHVIAWMPLPEPYKEGAE